MKDKLFTFIARLSTKRVWLILIITIIVVAFSGKISEKLVLKTNFKDLMPHSHPIVQEYDKIVDNFQGASVVIMGAVGNNEKSLVNFVDEIAPKIESYHTLVKNVEYKVNRKFIEKHGFMLMKIKDLKNNLNSFEDLGVIPYINSINNSFEKTYIADGEKSISNKEKEKNAITQLDGLETWIRTMAAYIQNPSDKNGDIAEKAVDKMLLGDEHFLSQDKKMIMFVVQPNFSVDDLKKSQILIGRIDSLLTETLVKYPDITLAGPTGTMALAADELKAVEKDMSLTTIIAFVLILALFVFSFRMWSAPILAFISLLFGIILTTGFVTLTIGSLNIMTSMFAIILIGLGIDFNIHVISTYNQMRAQNVSSEDAIKHTFKKSAGGILTGALTTALAFFTLMVSENQGMKEFGLVAGAGVIFCMLTSLVVLPALIVLHERIRNRNVSRIEDKMAKTDDKSNTFKKLKNKLLKTQKVRTTDYPFLGNLAEIFVSKRMLVISLAVAATSFLLYYATHLKFDYNYLNIEPKGIKSVVIQDSMINKFDLTPDIVMVTTNSVEESREIAEKAKDFSKIGLVSTISDYIPSPSEYGQKKEYIETIKGHLNINKASVLTIDDVNNLTDELYRLEDNFIELAQMAFTGGQIKLDQKLKELTGDLEISADQRKSMITELVNLIKKNPEKAIRALQFFQHQYEPELRNKLKDMCSIEPVTLQNLPNNIKDQFISTDGKSFLVTIFPKEQVWNGKFLKLFTNQMHNIDEKVTGMPLILYVLIDYIGKDGRLAAILAIIVIFLLVLLDFRNIKLALLTLVPLLFGFIWMAGLMSLFGIKINIINAIGLPLILGMGVDSGVHIIHRYSLEGANKVRTIFTTTGKAVLISSLTSFLAFGSLGFATYRGLASLGITLAIGITTCWLATVMILPALITFRDKRKLNK